MIVFWFLNLCYECQKSCNFNRMRVRSLKTLVTSKGMFFQPLSSTNFRLYHVFVVDCQNFSIWQPYPCSDMASEKKGARIFFFFQVSLSVLQKWILNSERENFLRGETREGRRAFVCQWRLGLSGVRRDWRKPSPLSDQSRCGSSLTLDPWVTTVEQASSENTIQSTL